jgi:PAS domain S-box-containing protein
MERSPRSQPGAALSEAPVLALEAGEHRLRLDFEDLRVFRDQLNEAAVLEPLQLLPFLFLTRNGVILHLNQCAAELLGLSKDAATFRPMPELIRAVDVPSFFKFLSICAGATEVSRGEFYLREQAPETLPMLFLMQRTESARKERPFFAVSILDPNPRPITSPPEAQLPNDYNSLVRAIDGVVWEAELPLRFIYVSEHCKKLLGFEAREWLRDRTFWENHVFAADRDRVMREREVESRKGHSHTLQYRMVTADRRLIWVQDSAEYVRLPGGKAKLVGIVTDVTELKENRDRLDKANQHLEHVVEQRTEKLEQSNKAMETLCYGIAHDLKSPIRCVQGMLSMLDFENGQLGVEARDYIQRAQNAMMRMGELVDAVLAFGRLNHVQPDLFAISSEEVLNRVIALLQPAIDEARATIHVARPLPRVIGNPYLLEQLFNNLIQNALKFTQPGTKPEIIIRALIRERRGGETPLVQLSVTDNGIGIPPDQQHRIFGMFQKLHRAAEYAGTGVGLALVKRAAEMMNGRVGLYSEAGQGSSFWVELPLAPDP